MKRPGNQSIACVVTWAGVGISALVPTALGQTTRSTETPREPVTTTRAAPENMWLRVTADEVNLRSRPDANSVPVTRVPNGTILRAAGSDAYGWYRIIPPDDVFSYVSAEYVDRRSATEGIVSVRSGTLRVRVGSLLSELDPLQSEVQALLDRGATMKIVGEQGPWLKIVPPSGVYVYVAGQHVERVSDEVAARWKGAKGPTTRVAVTTTRPAGERAEVPTTQAAVGPDVSGPWGQRLVLVETAIEAEGRKPLREQQWTEVVARMRPIAAQREEPMIAQLAAAWIATLERRIEEQAAVRDAEDVLERAARDRAQHEREMERIQKARQATTRSAYAARGELLRSYALGPTDGTRWYKLRDPLTQRIEAYVEVAAGAKVNAEELLGRYVGVRGARRSEPALGADVVKAEEIVVLERERPATQPSRQGT